jgi:integrase
VELRVNRRLGQGVFNVPETQSALGGGDRIQDGAGDKIAGKRPKQINATGPEVDGRFIQSRGVAQEKHDRLRDEIRKKHNLQEVQQKIIELKTGARLETVRLQDIVLAWDKIPRRRPLSKSHATNCHATLLRFVAFVDRKWPGVDDMASVAREHVAAFMEAEAARGLSPKSWNDVLKLLRSVFRNVQPEADAYRRYLLTTPTREKNTEFRRPFTPSELQAIYTAAKDDEFIRPLIVTAMCTALRRGDVCQLKWSNVSLGDETVLVKTSKTHQLVPLPIFPLLLDELKKRARVAADDEFVFPAQAAMYSQNQSGITWRIKRILVKALGGDAPDKQRLPELPPLATREKGNAYIDGLGSSQKAARMRAVFNAYMDGTPGAEIVTANGVSKGTVSGYLNEIELSIGARVIRGRHGAAGYNLSALIKAGGAGICSQKTKGLRRTSIRGFQSFRVTFVTIALTSGVPMELVRKITGHRTVEVVLTNYFHPGMDDIRKAFQDAMPRLLMNGAKSRDEQLLEMVANMSPETLKRDKARLLAVLNGKE